MAKHINYRTVAFLAAFSIVLGDNCTHEYVENINGICFEEAVRPIFQANCALSGCHNPTDRQGGYELTTYAGIVQQGVVPGDYRSSKIYHALVRPGGGAEMPPSPYGRLSDEQITTIALWIEQGAQNTANCSNGTACDTTAVTFSASVQPVLQTYCTVCHSGNPPQGGVGLTTYAGVKAMATGGTLVGVIEHRPGFSAMPKDGNKLSDCNIAKIRKWVELGAKND